MRTAPLPAAFRQNIPHGKRFFEVKDALSSLSLNTVCEEAVCPNRTDCYARGTLTFQILGDLCTRRCGFCAEKTGLPKPVDSAEPDRVAEAAARLHLSHAVVTAPARDDLRDGGASHFAGTVKTLRSRNPRITIETLVSDLQGVESSLITVLASGPDVFNHNIETVRRLTPKVRAKAGYDSSLKVLKFAAEFFRQNPALNGKVKSGLMAGLGETESEIMETFRDLREAGVQYVTLGQYLQPSAQHLPAVRYYDVKEFDELKNAANALGFEKVSCGPLVRSSYHADEMVHVI